MRRVALPIDPLLPDAVTALREKGALVLVAPPGAGKTTRVPRAILEAGLAGDKEVLVLQPRRLATRLAAARVAEELGERAGETAGYQVRFDEVRGPKTRLLFVTEGVLTRRLLSSPTLPGVGAVVLDEFHERHLAGDLGLALLQRLRGGRRPDLLLAVMSATIEAEPVAAYLGGCPVLRSEGRRFEVAIEHLPSPDLRPLEQQVLGALKRLAAAGAYGDVLVFLPGAAEIRRAREACEEHARRSGLELCALHGDLPAVDQDRAVRPGARRKVILSTNVAETSVTIEGVGAVVDSGLARIASHSPWSGLPALRVAKVSKASAAQRAGRAGRTRAGLCLRLYTREDYEARAEHEVPEIRRLDLSEAVLSLRASGVSDLSSFPFFEAPPPSALEAADSLLRRLGAVDREGGLTEPGRRVLRFPAHPRLSRVVTEAERRGVAAEGVAVAAILGERDVRIEARAQLQAEGRRAGGPSGPSDLLEILDRLDRARSEKAPASRMRAFGLDAGGAQAVERVRRQLGRMADRSAPRPKTDGAVQEAVLLSILAGYPDRVARRRKPNGNELLLCGGGSALLSEASVVREPELLVAIEAEERPGKGGPGAIVHMASKVEPEWLLELFPDELAEADELAWSESQERVERSVRLSYGGLVLEQSRRPAPPSEEAARLLLSHALAAGAGRFVDPEAMESFLARIELLGRTYPQAGFPKASDELVSSALSERCGGATSFRELEGALLPALSARLAPEQARLLSTHAPEHVALPGGRRVRVRYERGKPPHLASRLQDFFGMERGPTVCGGKVPLVLHLLAPNQRAVQVTTDLAGFWSRHYAAVKRELARKYPRHSWPEDPLRAQPPARAR
ncbi:MAG: ATP-dependent helicase HrpB [Myxococcales bacterium]|nr:ATP-dependent helicase HrpB [Myxococcales bacterium]